MSKNYLITTTLLDNFHWMETAPSSWKARAFQGFVDTLKRAPFNPTPEIKRGMDFEAKVNALVNGTREHFIEQVGANCSVFYDRCKGAIQQKKLKRLITVDGWSFQLYGKADYWTPDETLDAKTTGNYSKGRKKYTEKSQHIMYAYMEEKPAFSYLVAVFNDPEQGPLAARPDYVDVIDLKVDLLQAEQTITERIRSCISFIRNDSELKKAYLETFNWS